MILVINKSKRNAAILAEAFYYMGVLSRAVTEDEAVSEISELYKAVIIASPNEFSDKEELVSSLRNISDAPIFALLSTCTFRDRYIFDECLNGELYCSKIYDSIVSHFTEKKASPPGAYMACGINASAELSLPFYKGHILPFTKSETMILRTLIKLSPTPANTKEILKYAFRESRLPDISNVRTHISIMNKKFRELTGEKLISHSYNQGYIISV